MPELVATLENGTKRLAPRTGTSFLLNKGQVLTIIDPQGLQVADLLAFNAQDTRETLSNGRTFDYNKTIKLTTGNAIYSNRSNVLLSIVEDTVGVHDFLFTPCSITTFRLLYDDDKETDDKNDDHNTRPSCFGDFAFVLDKHDIPEDQIPVPFNCFMNVRVDGRDGASRRPPARDESGGLCEIESRDGFSGRSNCLFGTQVECRGTEGSGVSNRLNYPSIATAICKKPSGYAAAFPNSSIEALIGTTAPCSTGCARSGLRLLGNREGKVVFSAVPSVCGCREGRCKGINDCTTRMWPACCASSAIVSSAVGLADVGR